MTETKTQRVDRLIEDVAKISRATIPILAAKPENEKTLDDYGMEWLMSSVLFIHDGNTPDAEQLVQLKQVAASCAETYRMLRPQADDGTIEDDDQSLLNLCCAFLHLWRRNVYFTEGMKH